MITDGEIRYIRERLKESKRPLFFFDNDPDGTASFVLLYKMLGEGKGVCVKGKPMLEALYANKVEEYAPDLVVILDKPMVEQEFLDRVSVEVIWIDHHPLQDNRKVKYFNPLKHEPADNMPTSYWAYQIAREDLKDGLWLAMLGIVGDWNLLYAEELREQYPDLLPEGVRTAPEALFSSKLGLLIKILDFNLKGTTTQVMQSIKTLTRIEDPHEILEQSTARGKFIYRKYLAVNEKYEALKKEVKITNDPVIFYKYYDNKLAISGMLSNELLYLYPEKVIMIAREKNDDVMLSIRSGRVRVVDRLKKALEGVQGYGGGHDMACGACIRKEDFEKFYAQFRAEIERK